MIVDTSALVAIVLREPEAAEFDDRIRQTPLRRISAASYDEPLLFKGDFIHTDVRRVL